MGGEEQRGQPETRTPSVEQVASGPRPPDDAAIRQRVNSLALTHAAHTRAFLERPDRSIRNTELARALSTHAGAAAPPGGGRRPPAALDIGPLLGAGGMGVVHAADQVSLGRQVAVKTLKDDFAGEHATLMLLQEAFVMGRVEHPNILPIHDLQYDEGGNPQLVLKRIEGVEWRTLMADAAQVREQFAEADLLAWNLRVLMQVCDAIHFAHSRGIIHRDLKPTNVMIGRFGEVYVMDWGLALSMEEDAEGMLPFVDDAKQLAGTPQYMAPEMLGGEDVRLGPRTDVYLLGAVLYEILTDLPPHDGRSMHELIGAVLRSRPRFPPEAPSELVAICRRAMHPDPGRRFETVLSLRRALQAFLEHAGSRRLQQQAQVAATQLEAMIDGPKPVDGSALQELFAQCRFAYRQALELWPQNQAAARGLRAATVRMARHELSEDNPRIAQQLLATLPDSEPALAAEIEQALQRQLAEQRRVQDLERYQRETSIETGSRNRAIVALFLGLAWTVAPLLGPASLRYLSESQQRVVPSLFALGVVAALSTLWFLGREEIQKSRLTQYLLGGALVAMVALWVTEVTGYAMGLPMPLVQSLWPLTWFCISAMLTMTVDRRMWPMTLGFLGALSVAARFPEQRFLGMAGSNLVMTVNMFTIWLRPLGEGEVSMIERIRTLRRARRP